MLLRRWCATAIRNHPIAVFAAPSPPQPITWPAFRPSPIPSVQRDGGRPQCVSGRDGETPEDHYKTSLKRQDYGVPDELSLAELVQEHGIVAPIGKPGSAVIFDCNIMHGSNGNITPLPRSNAFFVYNAMSNRLERPFGTEKPRPDFIATRQPDPIVPATGSLGG